MLMINSEASGQPRTTRRAFLARLVKRVGLVLAVIAITWAGVVLVAGILRLIMHPRQMGQELGTGLAVVIGLAFSVAALLPPIAAGIIGAVIYPRRPRLAGVLAGIVAYGAAAAAAALTRGTISAALGPVYLRVLAPPHNQLGWTGLAVAVGLGVLWWGVWGNVGGACMAGWREGRQMRGTPNRSQA